MRNEVGTQGKGGGWQRDNAGHREDSHWIGPTKALDDLFVHSHGLYIYSNISSKRGRTAYFEYEKYTAAFTPLQQ
jgi:hypothetical protein